MGGGPVMSSTSHDPRILIIGAGVAGLSCAAELVKAGHSVRIIEARNRIGGRTHTDTVTLKDGTPIDLGGSFIHGLAGNPLYKLTKELGLDIYAARSPEKEKATVYSPEGPPLPLRTAQRIAFNSLVTFFGASADYAQDQSDDVPDKHESLGDYTKDPKRSALFEGLKTEAEKRYALQLSASWDGWTGASHEEVSLRYWQSDQTYRGPDANIVDGYRGIYEHFADIVRKDQRSETVLGEEVTAIDLQDDGKTVTIETKHTEGEKSQGKVYDASFVVCTLPLGVLQQRPPKFSPDLPKRRLDATARLGMGLLNKIILTYPSCFWPEDEPFFSMLPSKASEAFLPMLKDRALLAQNYKLVKGKNMLVFYCGAAFGAELEKHSDEKIKAGMHSILAHHFGDHPNFPKDGPDQIIVTRWLNDPYSCGAYSFIRPTPKDATEQFTPYDFNELARPLWEDRLFFAGEGTDSDHYATVHGALVSGRREATRILAKMEQDELEA